VTSAFLEAVRRRDVGKAAGLVGDASKVNWTGPDTTCRRRWDEAEAVAFDEAKTGRTRILPDVEAEKLQDPNRVTQPL